MLESHYLYLCLNILTVIFPIAWSFEPKMHFISYWKPAFIAIIIIAFFKIIWDCAFTAMGVWGFEADYIIGFYIANLPFEEILFFITIPFASLFIYASCKFYKWQIPLYITRPITILLAFLLLAIALSHSHLWYTAVSFLLAGLLLLFTYFALKANLLGTFWIAYTIVLFPFFIVNGILTGSFTNKPVVWYNDLENLGIRIFTIPIEDLVFNLVLYLGCVLIFEFLQKTVIISKNIS